MSSILVRITFDLNNLNMTIIRFQINIVLDSNHIKQETTQL